MKTRWVDPQSAQWAGGQRKTKRTNCWKRRDKEATAETRWRAHYVRNEEEEGVPFIAERQQKAPLVGRGEGGRDYSKFGSQPELRNLIEYNRMAESPW